MNNVSFSFPVRSNYPVRSPFKPGQHKPVTFGQQPVSGVDQDAVLKFLQRKILEGVRQVVASQSAGSSTVRNGIVTIPENEQSAAKIELEKLLPELYQPMQRSPLFNISLFGRKGCSNIRTLNADKVSDITVFKAGDDRMLLGFKTSLDFSSSGSRPQIYVTFNSRMEPISLQSMNDPLGDAPNVFKTMVESIGLDDGILAKAFASLEAQAGESLFSKDDLTTLIKLLA